MNINVGGFQAEVTERANCRVRIAHILIYMKRITYRQKITLCRVCLSPLREKLILCIFYSDGIVSYCVTMPHVTYFF